MADPIDVDKLKNDAFNAIDALFIEDEEHVEDSPAAFSPAVEEPAKPKKSELIVSSMDDFAILDEFILALDWEYSETEIKRFVEHLKNIQANNSDPYNQALVKMLNSIITYLIKAKNKAYPETFNKLSELIGVLKQINAPGMTTDQIKSEVSAAYKKVKTLKKQIADYNSKLDGNAAQPSHLMPQEKTRLQPVPPKVETQIETVGSADFIDEEDVFSAKTDEVKPVSGSIEPGDLEEIESKIIDRLNQYEQRLAFLEKQNQALRQIIVDQKETNLSSLDIAEEVVQAVPSEEEGDSFGFDDFVAEFETLSPIDESEPETVDIEDIISQKLEPEQTFGNGDLGAFSSAGSDDENVVFGIEDNTGFPGEDSAFGAMAGTDDSMFETEEGAEEYVRVFRVDDQKIAVPIDYFNNMYKLPSNLRSRINSMDSIRLGELASFFRRLSRNMKGSLQGLKEKELKGMTVQVSSLVEDPADFPLAVLCSCDNTSVLVPVSDQYKSGNIISGVRNSVENRMSKFSVKIEEEVIPLIVPC